ncbi:MAG: hypothetical protein RJB66_862 [Pseudomonadota bacterium]|jgi:predicted aminopeptidase
MDVLVRWLVTALALTSLSGCQFTYLVKNAYNQMNILYQRQPIDQVIASGKLNEKDKAKLELSQSARLFAQEKLLLNVGKNYASYVQLNKPYVVWSVNASHQWKLEHFLWHFPIVGDVPYKGFPEEEDAKKEASLLQSQGYDTYVRGVSAYSTLGWFNDPILSSMMRYSDEDLVNTIIHESVHATIYIKSNADFNERLATFLGDKGTELYYLETEGTESIHLQKMKDENEDQKIFSAFISDEIKKLGVFYDSNPKKDLSLRENQFVEIKNRFRMLVRPILKTDSYSSFEKITLNNARLLLFKTYVADLSDFQRLLDSVNGDLILFINKIKTLESHPNPAEGLKKLI